MLRNEIQARWWQFFDLSAIITKEPLVKHSRESLPYSLLAIYPGTILLTILHEISPKYSNFRSQHRRVIFAPPSNHSEICSMFRCFDLDRR